MTNNNPLQGRLNQANGRLKAAKTGVKIEQIGQRLYLQATLPPKPSSSKLHAHQQRIALHLYASTTGIQEAEKEARKIGALVACNQFDWASYLPKTHQTQTVKDWLRDFEQDYFTRRAKTPESETTWKTDYHNAFKKLPLDAPLTADLLLNAITQTPPDTRTRKRVCIAFSALAKWAGLELDLTTLVGRYSPKTVTPRNLPDDQQIAQTFYQINNPAWRWVYGMLATYGLRPHEVFLLDPNGFDDCAVVCVLDGKTGPRRIYPIYPEWVDSFALKDFNQPKCSGRNHSDLGNRVTHAFRREKVNFKPYDLRHCWAIRALEFGLDVSLAAQQMGHSVKVHTELYHHWIDDRHHRKAFEILMARRDRPKPPTMNAL